MFATCGRTKVSRIVVYLRTREAQIRLVTEFFARLT
jgi:hypothetical protein